MLYSLVSFRVPTYLLPRKGGGRDGEPEEATEPGGGGGKCPAEKASTRGEGESGTARAWAAPPWVGGERDVKEPQARGRRSVAAGNGHSGTPPNRPRQTIENAQNKNPNTTQHNKGATTPPRPRPQTTNPD